MRKRIMRLVIKVILPCIVMSLFQTINIQAASFDCDKATTGVENMICSDMDLSQTDEDMARDYINLLQDEKNAEFIKQNQRDWIKKRDRCVNKICLENIYKERLDELSAIQWISLNLQNKEQRSKLEDLKPLRVKFIRRYGLNAEPFKFKLTKGQGIPVCEDYLQRLNASDFDNAPFCGRPEDTSIQGFTRLNRIPLSAYQIYALLPKVQGFESSQNQDYWKEEFMEITSVKKDMSMNRLGAWGFDPPVDIDNDGKPDNIILWNRGRFSCGSENFNSPFPAHSSYTAIVLDGQNRSIDEARTRDLFEHPMGWFEMKTKRFRFIGMSMGIFAYKGTFYFDTFFDGWGDYEGQRRDSKIMKETLAVFLRKDKKTNQICEYHWTNYENLYQGENAK